MQFIKVQTKRNKEKLVVTKICFYGKTKQNIKVGATKIQSDGSDKKESSVKYAFMVKQNKKW